MRTDDAILPGGQNEGETEGDSDQLPLEDTLLDRGLEEPVSYTHLTLPTIYSV